MTSVLSYRPSTSGTTGSSSGTTLNRQASLSSFPSTRTPSNPSVRNGNPLANIPRMPRRGSMSSSSQTPSTPSSTQQTPQRSGISRSPRKLRSQYPADSAEQHVEYILVASFHVDRGPIMEHQYPGAISGDEGMLAELMLPDQVHNRKEDWTVFFLHKDTSEEDPEGDKRDSKIEPDGSPAPGDVNGDAVAGANEREEEHGDNEGGEGPPLIYVLNLVNTKHDASAKRPSGEVAEAVLAACALASGGILRGFTRHAFPYTDLTKIDDLLNVPGFIAGVTNPTFANHHEWWDLLCDVPTGRMKISSRIENAGITDGLVYFQQQNPGYAPNGNGVGSGNSSLNTSGDATGDTAFVDSITSSIHSRHGESVIRSKWRDYIIKFTRIAAAFEESVYGASALYIGASEADSGVHGVRGHGYVWPDDAAKARELGANVWRIEGWRNTRSYYAFIQDLAAMWERRPIRSIDLAYQHDRLRSLKLSHEDSAAIYLALSATVHTYDEVCQLLCVTPESNAGIFYVSLGLFHPEAKVRVATVELLERIMVHEAGRHFWAQLGRFAKLAFIRTKRECVKASEVDDSPTENGIGLSMDARIAGRIS
ncbi:hypothetical protein P7C71_g5197, partial [Lecanoromycetidae sp. Uapishka_2]